MHRQGQACAHWSKVAAPTSAKEPNRPRVSRVVNVVRLFLSIIQPSSMAPTPVGRSRRWFTFVANGRRAKTTTTEVNTGKRSATMTRGGGTRCSTRTTNYVLTNAAGCGAQNQDQQHTAGSSGEAWVLPVLARLLSSGISYSSSGWGSWPEPALYIECSFVAR